MKSASSPLFLSQRCIGVICTARPTLCGTGLPSWSVLVNLRTPSDIEALPSNPMFGSSWLKREKPKETVSSAESGDGCAV